MNLADSALRAPAGGTRRALASVLDDVESELLAADTAEAVRKLENVRRRMDGCGAVADTNDWIVRCADQRDLRALIDLLTDNLERA